MCIENDNREGENIMLYHVALQNKDRVAVWTDTVEAGSEMDAIKQARATSPVDSHIAIYAEAVSAFDPEVYHDA